MKEGRYTRQPEMPGTPPRTLPAGSCDCHGHIFPSAALYPTHNETMPLAPVELFLAVHRHFGFARGVLVQGGAYRHDNRAMLDALARFPDALRGVALLGAEADDATLAAMAAGGVRALRFTRGGASRIEDLRALAPRMREHGLHAELFIGCAAFAERGHELLALGLPLVLDHLAGPLDPADGIVGSGFAMVLDALSTGRVWVKLTPQRNSARVPRYDDVRPFADRLVAHRPDRLVWGSDWPFPNMSDETPSMETLLDVFGDWVGDPALRQRILVDNPAALYGWN